MKRSLCMVGLMLCIGCATAVVRPYVGEQQNWPTATGSIVNTRYSLPVFTSLPSAAYDIIAEMRIESLLYAQPEEGHLPVLVKKAKKIGADALVFVEGQVFFAANYGSRTTVADAGGAAQPSLTQVNRFNPESFKQGVTIIAVKWTGDPPVGLPNQEKKKAKKEEAPAAAAAPAPAPEPTPAPEVAPAPAPAPEVPAAPEPPKMKHPPPPLNQLRQRPSLRKLRRRKNPRLPQHRRRLQPNQRPRRHRPIRNILRIHFEMRSGGQVTAAFLLGFQVELDVQIAELLRLDLGR